MAPATTSLNLPISISSKSDFARLLRELRAIDDFLNQAAIRQPGTGLAMPKTSKAMQEVAVVNGANLLEASQRKELLHSFSEYHDNPRVVHISFAAEPSLAFTQKITTWMRENIDPLVLLQIGLQPDIAAGCTVRTTNKYYDLSLRKEMTKHRKELIGLISGKVTEAETTQLKEEAEAREAASEQTPVTTEATPSPTSSDAITDSTVVASAPVQPVQTVETLPAQSSTPQVSTEQVTVESDAATGVSA